jgi:hypothetical protein
MSTSKTRPAPWSVSENAALISLYFDMLDAALIGTAYNKAEMIRLAQAVDESTPGSDVIFTGSMPDWACCLSDRSRGSVEAKLMNASACHRDLIPDATTMDGFGYRALSNYQATLKTAMTDALYHRAEIAEQVSA